MSDAQIAVYDARTPHSGSFIREATIAPTRRLEVAIETGNLEEAPYPIGADPHPIRKVAAEDWLGLVRAQLHR